MQPMLPLAAAQPDRPFVEADTYMSGGNILSDMALKLQVPFGCTGRTTYAAHHGEESNQIE
jgi:hypothetical protein